MKGVAGRVLGGAVYLPIVILQVVPAQRVGLEDDCLMTRVSLAETKLTREEKTDKLMVAMTMNVKLEPVGKTS